MIKFFLLLAYSAFVCEGNSVKKNISSIKNRVVKSKFINKPFRHLAFKFLVPKFKSADWGECVAKETPSETNPCITECVYRKREKKWK